MIFIDVGAHEGQTLAEAVRYDFDRIFAFEPMLAEYRVAAARFGDRAEVLNAGLSDADECRPVYGSNASLEASVFAGKTDVDDRVVNECSFIQAAGFFRTNVPDDARVFLKLNCEGSEIAILNNLIDTGEVAKVTSALVDFDSAHVPGMEEDEAAVRERLGLIGFDGLVTSADVVPRGRERRDEGTYRYTRADEIMCWLKSHGIAER